MVDEDVNDSVVATNDGVTLANRIRDLDDHAERNERYAACDKNQPQLRPR